jgi:thioredoxin-related protein
VNLYKFIILFLISLPLKGINFVDWSFSESVAQAKYRKKPIFLFVYSDNCIESRRMEDIFKMKDVNKLYNAKFLCVKYRLDDNFKKRIQAERWGVTSYPTFIFFDKNGNKILIEDGYHNYYKFMEMTNKAIVN